MKNLMSIPTNVDGDNIKKVLSFFKNNINTDKREEVEKLLEKNIERLSKKLSEKNIERLSSKISDNKAEKELDSKSEKKTDKQLDESEKLILLRLLLAKLFYVEKKLNNKGIDNMRWKEFNQCYLKVLNLLSELVPEHSSQLFELAITCFTCKKPYFGKISWSNIIDFISADVIVNMLTRCNRINPKNNNINTLITSNGTLVASQGKLAMYPYIAKSMDIDEDYYPVSLTMQFDNSLHTEFTICSEKEIKLTQKKAEDISAIYEFMNNYIDSLENKSIKLTNRKKSYRLDDKLSVEVKGFEGKDILLTSRDEEYTQISGPLKEECFTPYYDFTEYASRLKIGDILPRVKKVDKGKFSVKESFVKLIYDKAQNRCKDYQKYGKTILAKACDFYHDDAQDLDKIKWLSEDGFFVQTSDNKEVEFGDYAELGITNTNIYETRVYVNAEIVDLDIYDDFNSDQAFRQLIEDYSKLSQMKPFRKHDSALLPIKIFFDEDVEQMTDILARSADYEKDTLLRFKKLVFAAILYSFQECKFSKEMREAKLQRVKSKIDALRILNLFAKRKLNIELLEKREKQEKNLIFTVIKYFACPDKLSDFLKDYTAKIINFDENDKVVLVWKAVMKSLLIDNKEDIENCRWEICSVLDVEDLYVPLNNEENKQGKYGNIESPNLEFKASYVYRSDGKGANYKIQGRNQIFKAVCGMLNAEGGEVLLGVHDNGDPYHNPGSNENAIQTDIAWFKKNRLRVIEERKNVLHRNITVVNDVDSFCRFLNDEVDVYFEKNIKNYIQISASQDKDAIFIRVSSYKDGIAYLKDEEGKGDGEAYVRVGLSTRKMDSEACKSRLNRLKNENPRAKMLDDLSHAMKKRLVVNIIGYKSSNGGKIADYKVLPINFISKNEGLWCYDIESHSKKQFILSRIETIELTSDEYNQYFEKVESDIFRWASEEEYHIKLKLKLSAYNRLMELYPQSHELSNDPKSLNSLYECKTDELQSGEPRWILNVICKSLLGVRNFYISNAYAVEILDSPDAQQFVASINDYIEANLSNVKVKSI